MAQLSQEIAPTLRDYAHVVWLRKWVVVLCVVLFVAAALAYSLTKPKRYEATARLMYAPPTNVASPNSNSTVDLTNLTIQLQSVGNTIASPKVRTAAEDALSGQEAAGDYSVTATVVTPSGTSSTAIADSVDVTAQASTPQAAAHIANAYAEAVIELRKSAQQEQLSAAQHVIQQQLDAFQSAQSKLSPDYAALSLQLRDLQLAEATATGDFIVLAPATPPSSPASPKPVKTAMLGLIAGLFVGIVGAFVLGQFDVKVRTYREVASALGLNIVGRIPRLPHSTRGDELVALTEPEGTFSEALRILRSNLDWSNIDEHLRVLLVSSCLKGEGKTLALCNLAVTLARAGKKVVVIDADLRSPRVHRLFNVTNTSGLTSVALGSVNLETALQRFERPAEVNVRTPAQTGRPSNSRSQWEGSLRILTSGPMPPNPGEVVASRRVASVIEAVAQQDVDYVLVDVPPLLGFGDAGALAPTVDGLLMVASIKKARRPILEEGREILESLPCRKVGVVVIGEKIEDSHYAAAYASR